MCKGSLPDLKSCKFVFTFWPLKMVRCNTPNLIQAFLTWTHGFSFMIHTSTSLYLARSPPALPASLLSLQHSRHMSALMQPPLYFPVHSLAVVTLCSPSPTYTETLKGHIPHSKMQQLPQLTQTSSLASLLPTGLRSKQSLYFCPLLQALNAAAPSLAWLPPLQLSTV